MSELDRWNGSVFNYGHAEFNAAVPTTPQDSSIKLHIVALHSAHLAHGLSLASHLYIYTQDILIIHTQSYYEGNKMCKVCMFFFIVFIFLVFYFLFTEKHIKNTIEVNKEIQINRLFLSIIFSFFKRLYCQFLVGSFNLISVLLQDREL